MRLLRSILLGFVVLLIAACAEGTTATSLPEALDEAGDDVSAAVEAAQQELEDLGQQIENSEANEDLQAAWDDLQAELNTAFESLQSGEAVDAEGIEETLQDFQDELEAAGDEIEPELRSAWDTLREQIEQLFT